MKKILLISLAFMIGLATVAQKPQVKNGIYVRNVKKVSEITIEPASPTSISPVKTQSSLKNGSSTNIVSVLNLGTSANCLGYSSGTRPMLWADDALNAVINFHRAGPGTIPSLSGYYAMDLGTNMGAAQTDWNNQIQVLAAQMVASPYYYDASRYPCAGIYNPTGNTTLANAYCAYFGPNFANLAASGFGGYSYGVANLVNHADTTKNLRWYDGKPPTYIPDGFAVSGNGLAHELDGGYNVISATYIDSVVYGRGVWNAATKDFDYTFKTIAFPTVDSYSNADCKIAVAPDGNTVWMSVLCNLVGASPLIDSTFFPVLRRSLDGGATWGAPIIVQLDGPNGIAAVKNHYSDYFINNFFTPPAPTRDQIPYTTAFDHSLSVDKWGNPHMGIAIGYAPGGYSISTGVDSLINVYDIYSVDDGAHFAGVFLGSLKTFRGTWATYTADNRVYISRTTAGDKMFVTWNDTHIDGEVNNQNPEVWARGFDLIANKITANNGVDGPNNVTFLSDITQEAYFQCTSPIVFTDNNKFTIPIATQWAQDFALDVQFKYIPDFSYVQSDFSIPVLNDPFPIGIEKKDNSIASVTVFPNPVKDVAKVAVTLKQNANVSVDITNLVGQQVMSLNKGAMNAGTQQFSIDASSLTSGVYFISVNVNGQKYTQKMIVQ
ncbi:MAG: T9SS type A sorting domain-containing protein [bacterium]